MGFWDNRGRGKRTDAAAKVTPEASAVPTEPTASDPSASVQPKPRKKLSIFDAIIIVMMIVGVSVIAYPTFSDWWNTYHQSRAISNYVDAVEQIDPEQIKQMLADADAYNQRLLSLPDRYRPTSEQMAEYESLLDPTGTGVIGYVQIDSIGVNLPIYHGTDEAVLQVAIGHIVGSSLPVGGKGTHSVVSGHRGLPSAKLFTDLDKMVEGDVFSVTVLDRTVTYEVDQIRIVDPEDTSSLNIEQGKDYMTLVTCTPYGINTHRILVRGHRIENLTGRVVIPPEAVQIPNYVAVPAVAIPMLFVYLVVTLVYYRVRRPELDREAAMAMLRERANADTTGEDSADHANVEAEEAREAADGEHADADADASAKDEAVTADVEDEATVDASPDDADDGEGSADAGDDAPATDDEGSRAERV